MGPTLFVLLAIICASASGVRGECRNVPNEDMIEYICEGGSPAELNNLPAHTGKIRIINMPIRRITPDTFSRFGSDLWVLACSHCGIEDIEPGAFDQLDNLQQLSLDNNRLTTVKGDWFRGQEYLTYLDLNYNYINTIEDGVFANLPSLVDLRLSGNRMECLNLEDMSNLPLRRIFLSENPELKCPNAISQFLEDRGVSFEPDPEWRRIPTDLVNVNVPGKQNILETTTPLPAFRERLHLTPSSPAPEERRTTHPSTRYYPTEEIFYSTELVTPTWVTTPEDDISQSALDHTSTPESTTPRTHYERPWTVYESPQTVAPPETITYPYYYVPSRNSDETGDRSWPEEPKTSIQTSERHPASNEDEDYEEIHYPSRTTRPPFLANSPTHRQEQPTFVEPEMERTTNPYRNYWTVDEDEDEEDGEDEEDEEATRYPVEDDYPIPVTGIEEETHVARPMPSPVTDEFLPSGPDDFFGRTYFDPTVTIQPRLSLDNYEERQEESTRDVLSIETTTTDKPLPNCPGSASSKSIDRSIVHLIILSLLLVLMKNVVVEGF